MSLTVTLYQLGAASRSLWQPAGLDTISGCLATGDYPASSRHQLGARPRVTSPLGSYANV